MQGVLQKTWCNQDNRPFYEKMSLAEFLEHARLSGIGKGEDIEQIKDLILKSESVLEVGCGYGRVLKKILEYGYHKKLESIEINKKSCLFCQHHFGSNVKIYNEDILSYRSKKKYDLILFMWSGISEFCPKEQRQLFGIYSHLLTAGGCLVVEKIDCNQPKNKVDVNDNNWNVEGEYSSESLYMPKEEELEAYADAYKMICKKKISYKASNGVPRVIYLFSLS